MYRRTGQCSIDAVYMAELEVKQPDPSLVPMIRATMVYVNSETGLTYGTVPLVYPPANVPAEFITKTVSQRSLDLLLQLRDSLEIDFGKMIFEAGALEKENQPQSGTGESDRPISAGLGSKRD